MATTKPHHRAEVTADQDDPRLRPGPDTNPRAGADQPPTGDLRFEKSRSQRGGVQGAGHPNMTNAARAAARVPAGRSRRRATPPANPEDQGWPSGGRDHIQVPQDGTCRNKRISREKRQVTRGGTRQVPASGTTMRKGFEMALPVGSSRCGNSPTTMLRDRAGRSAEDRERARMAAREQAEGDRDRTFGDPAGNGTAMEVERRRPPAARFARRAMGKAVLAAIGAVAAGGCKSPDQTASVLATLERGRAEGHLTVTTSGAVGVGQKTTLWAGADGTTVAFDGSVDFDPEGRQATPLPPAGG